MTHKDRSYHGRIKPRFPPYVGRNMRDRCLKTARRHGIKLFRKEMAALEIIVSAWANSSPVTEAQMNLAVDIVARAREAFR